MRSFTRALLQGLAALIVCLILASIYMRSTAPEITPDKIVAVYDPRTGEAGFLSGVGLAVERINALGGVRGVPLRLQTEAETIFGNGTPQADIVNNLLRRATTLGQDPSVLAVIGHSTSEAAIGAASVYEHFGKLFISTHATNPTVTNLRFQNVLALQPNDSDIAHVITRHALRNGIRNIVIVDDNSRLATSIVTRFTGLFAMQGGNVLLRSRELHMDQNFDKTISYLLDNRSFQTEDIDAILLVSKDKANYPEFIKRAHRLGLRKPFIGTSEIISTYVLDSLTSDERKGLMAFSLFDGSDQWDETKEFNTAFAARFQKTPDSFAAVGFDAVNLVRYAIDQTGSREALRLANWLRVMRFAKTYIGATGRIEFDGTGLITGTDTFVLEHDGIRLQTVATYTKPFPWLTSKTGPSDDMLRGLNVEVKR